MMGFFAIFNLRKQGYYQHKAEIFMADLRTYAHDRLFAMARTQSVRELRFSFK